MGRRKKETGLITMNPYIQYMYSYPHKTAYGPLSGIRWQDYAARLSGGENSLYFHIPFCESKCGYCNLFSVVGQGEAFMEQYVDAMERQAAQWSAVFHTDAVSHADTASCTDAVSRIDPAFADLTLGGGTPLLLPERQLERVFRIAREQMGFEEGKHPVIVETSPGQTTEEKLCLLKEHHVTRISMGVQSFHADELKAIQRSHSPEQVERAMEMIQKVGFPCVNLDLIYGIPGQTEQSLRQSVERALAFRPEELFVYPLYIKKGTYLFGRGVQRPESTYQMYIMIREYLKEKGYVPYSMRRFVRRDSGAAANGGGSADVLVNGSVGDFASCGFGNTVSIGCGGRSYIDNLHFCTPYAVRQGDCMKFLRQYMDEDDYLEIRHGYVLSGEEQKRRYVIKNVLFGSGLSKDGYTAAFSGDAEEDFPVLRQWIGQNYAYEANGRIILTEEGFSLSDYLGPMLISDEVREAVHETDLLSGESGIL